MEKVCELTEKFDSQLTKKENILKLFLIHIRSYVRDYLLS